MILKRYFSATGLLVGTFFFALSMTPSLLPRTDLFQGLVSGFSLAAGYGIGVLGPWLWTYFELPKPSKKNQSRLQIIAAIICIVTGIVFLWSASDWQNSIRSLMGMDELAGVQPVIIGLTAIGVFLAVLYTARLFRWTFRLITVKLLNYIPRKVSYIIGLLTAFILFWSVVNGVLFSLLLRSADTTYERVDSLLEPEFEQPTDPLKAGSIQSLLSWEDMGRTGRRFVSGGPSLIDLQRFTDDSVQNPVRVYVGMNAAETVEERADLALQELIRLNAFDREIMVIITPTGTGWVDPGSIETLEYLFRGDVASVAAQYSYLPSPLSLWVEEEYGAEMAQALFQKVYGYWTQLPRDNRPKLYLHGLSLGALNSDRSFDLYDIIDDPFNGALWVGPPFRKETWRTFTERRDPDSPAWLPTFRDGSVVRFANQNGGLEKPGSEWGGFRIAYLQYASDPIVFFDSRSYWREPAWMREPRGPDVSADLRWYPVVTMVQLAVDMVSGTEPRGFGHDYAAEHYFDSWLALTEPEGWSNEQLERLRQFFSEIN
ncbi:MAG: alpha/beta-hydrolase family protein [Balneolaceae bacterium]|nr:alpha/beta-hydrolase family protein [Balneolaceae bacterium]